MEDYHGRNELTTGRSENLSRHISPQWHPQVSHTALSCQVSQYSQWSTLGDETGARYSEISFALRPLVTTPYLVTTTFLVTRVVTRGRSVTVQPPLLAAIVIGAELAHHTPLELPGACVLPLILDDVCGFGLLPH